MTRDDLIVAPKASEKAPRSLFGDELMKPLLRLRGEVDRLFDDFPFRFPSLHVGNGAPVAGTALEMTETDQAFKVSVELPGLGAEDVDVSIDDGVLRIAGEKKQEREENERGYRVSERSYGSFERLIQLPATADEEKISAAFRNGVLTVTVPKGAKAEDRARKIAINQE